MNNGKKTLGICMTGSFCTFSEVIPQIECLAKKYDLLPVMSFNAYNTDTRFGARSEFIERFEHAAKRKIIHSIEDAEPIGAKGLCDAVLIMPCTGNTAAKLALGITDTPVTMAAKGHLRNGRPLIIAISSNDAMGANGRNLAQLMNTKNIYLVPYRQDDCNSKPMSLMADFSQAIQTVSAALEGIQLQPVLLQK